MLQQYGWPGNVRELRNAIERAMLLIEGERLEPEHFTTLTRTVAPTQFRLPAEGVNLDDVERQLLTQALERAHGNQTQAAQLLGINRDQVRYRIEKFGLIKAKRKIPHRCGNPFRARPRQTPLSHVAARLIKRTRGKITRCGTSIESAQVSNLLIRSHR